MKGYGALLGTLAVTALALAPACRNTTEGVKQDSRQSAEKTRQEAQEVKEASQDTAHKIGDMAKDVGGPTIIETSPREIRAGVAFNVQPTGEAALAVIGRGFEPGDVIVWNEVALATTHANSGLLTAIVPARLYKTPGRVIVRVRSAERAITIVP